MFLVAGIVSCFISGMSGKVLAKASWECERSFAEAWNEIYFILGLFFACCYGMIWNRQKKRSFDMVKRPFRKVEG